MECNICCNISKKFINCIYCNKEACVKCVERHLLETSKCVFCLHIWPYEVIRTMAPLCMVKRYTNNRKAEIFELEKKEYIPRFIEEKEIETKQNWLRDFNRSLSYFCSSRVKQQTLFMPYESDFVCHPISLPSATDIFSLEETEMISQTKNEIMLQYDEILQQNEEFKTVYTNLRSQLVAKINDFNNSYRQKQEQMKDNVAILQASFQERYTLSKEKEKKEIVKSCINCPGIMVKNKCTSCNTETCSKCLLIKLENHQCEKTDLQSVAAMKAMSVQCPKCSIFIIKSEGCNDMWCVSCHTGFHYRTKKIISGKVHNPEYFAFIASQNKKTLSGAENNCVDMAELIQLCRNNKYLGSIIRAIEHAFDMTWRQDYYEANQKNRQDYISSSNKEKFLNNSIKVYKKVDFNRQLNDIYLTLREIGLPLVRDVALQTTTNADYTSLKKFTNMINDDIQALCCRYQYTTNNRIIKFKYP